MIVVFDLCMQSRPLELGLDPAIRLLLLKQE